MGHRLDLVVVAHIPNGIRTSVGVVGSDTTATRASVARGIGAARSSEAEIAVASVLQGLLAEITATGRVAAARLLGATQPHGTAVDSLAGGAYAQLANSIGDVLADYPINLLNVLAHITTAGGLAATELHLLHQNVAR